VAEFEPVLTRWVNEPDSHTLAVYQAHGGYETLKRVLAEKSPTDVVEEVKASELRGRGGAGFPTGVKWTFLPKDHPGPVYMCVNADESEPGTFCNRLQMEEDPHQVLEGVILACYATKAATAYIYMRVEYYKSFQRMQAAIDELVAAGLLGKKILGHDFDLDVTIHRGAGAYVCGEETGLIESLEGKRAWPRNKPPFPAVEGLFHKPTVVNNIETLACVKHIMERGADWFRSIGVEGSYGPKLYGLSGHVNRPGVYELPLGVTCGDLIQNHGGGILGGRKAKAAVPGGLSMGFLKADEFDTALDFDSLRKVGCLGLGTAAVIVMDETVSMVEVVHNACRFFAHESCGQCTPCREGTTWMTKIMERILAGGGTPEDLDLLMEIAGGMGIIPGTTICGLSDGAAWPVKNGIMKFRDEFDAAVGNKTAAATV